jgi:hypothetical protein
MIELRAAKYRAIHNIYESLGTAVIVQVRVISWSHLNAPRAWCTEILLSNHVLERCILATLPLGRIKFMVIILAFFHSAATGEYIRCAEGDEVIESVERQTYRLEVRGDSSSLEAETSIFCIVIESRASQ